MTGKQAPFIIINDTRPALTTGMSKANGQSLTTRFVRKTNIDPGLKLSPEQRFGLIRQDDLVVIPEAGPPS